MRSLVDGFAMCRTCRYHEPPRCVHPVRAIGTGENRWFAGMQHQMNTQCPEYKSIRKEIPMKLSEFLKELSRHPYYVQVDFTAAIKKAKELEKLETALETADIALLLALVEGNEPENVCRRIKEYTVCTARKQGRYPEDDDYATCSRCIADHFKREARKPHNIAWLHPAGEATQ